MKILALEYLKVRSRLRMYINPADSEIGNPIVNSSLEARIIALKNKWINFYRLDFENYVIFDDKDVVVKKQTIESAARGEIFLLSDILEQIKCEDFAIAAKRELTGTILKIDNIGFVPVPSQFNYLILDNGNIKRSFLHMLDVIEDKINC